MEATNERMHVQLLAVSPVAFMLAREGDKALVKRSPPKPREYRDKIGPASEAYLVFKGETKIGMIPREFINDLGDLTLKRMCRIARMDRDSNLVLVELFAQDIAEV
jgi:hypothetical protein